MRRRAPRGSEWVKVTGGEPFLRADTIEIIATLRAEGLAVDVETNGTLVDDPLARALARAGVRQVSVSLDGGAALDARRHARPARRPRARGAGDPAAGGAGGARAGAVHVVPRQRSRGRRAPRSVRRARGRLVQAQPPRPDGAGPALHRDGAALPVAAALAVVRHVEDRRGPGLPFPVATSVPLAFTSRARLREGEGHVCPIRNIVGLLADGRAALCGVGYLAPDLVVERPPRFARGCLARQPAAARPPRPAARAAPRGVRPVPHAGRLPRRLSRQRVPPGGDLYAPFWFCEEAERAGLFPAERLETA
ncbi:MAG: radical SAM protein [Rhodopseudomonas palustris]|nr:radical SAM protein [Rhodopseudomonas palustris]